MVVKFFGLYFTEWGIEANSDKREAVIQMNLPTLNKVVRRLNGILVVLGVNMEVKNDLVGGE